MTYEEKLAFVKEHLGEECEFGIAGVYKLCGITVDGMFIDDEGDFHSECRLVPKKKLIPWTFETAESVQLRHKKLGHKVWMNYGLMFAWYHAGEFTTRQAYGSLLTDWETVDDHPCGTEEKS